MAVQKRVQGGDSFVRQQLHPSILRIARPFDEFRFLGRSSALPRPPASAKLPRA
jgi:hypothetical protein